MDQPNDFGKKLEAAKKQIMNKIPPNMNSNMLRNVLANTSNLQKYTGRGWIFGYGAFTGFIVAKLPFITPIVMMGGAAYLFSKYAKN